jgi:hypothetical protein
MASERSWRLTLDERRELWCDGQTLTAIEEPLCLASASVFVMVRIAGGFSPPERSRTRED